MNKKLFGTLLLGSLLMGGTFVSCQDYDDDIKDLQAQIGRKQNSGSGSADYSFPAIFRYQRKNDDK